MEKETYSILIEVRDSNGKLIQDDKGHKITGLKTQLTCSSVILERELTAIGERLSGWMPDRKITVEASLPNSISGTWMSMAEYRSSEKRFVEF